ncbi:MAG: hypothetical protein AB7G93_20660 [Bdellovibrionales bacterium]
MAAGTIKKMVSRRYVLIPTILSLGFLLLIQFQNCAPANSIPSNATSGSQVRIVDEWNKVGIQFVFPTIELHDEAVSAELTGVCNREHSGKLFVWTAGTMGGTGMCRAGGFSLSLQDLDQIVCGVEHLVTVEASWGESTFTYVVKRCQPLASQPVQSPAGSPYGTSCALEYALGAEEATSPCSQVCYREQKVVSNIPVDASQCAGIAAQLAGTSP